VLSIIYNPAGEVVEGSGKKARAIARLAVLGTGYYIKTIPTIQEPSAASTGGKRDLTEAIVDRAIAAKCADRISLTKFAKEQNVSYQDLCAAVNSKWGANTPWP